ncbi:MAG: diguanylate cyclase [Planctomycetes bacterium]|nr:diguanylate cyclase [Planctomycetota bacterium]
MTRPGFRKGRPGGLQKGADDAAEGFLSSALFSQAQILHLMKNEFARARRHGIPLGCVLMQVDRLPQLVDLHGAGLRSAVRQTMGRLVKEKTRGGDLLGATNDDRYLLVLPHTNLAQTRVVADRLHQLFGDLEIAVEGRVLALSLSVGISACADQQTMFFDTLVGQAEAALDYALRSGGDQVVSFGEAQLRGGAGEPPPGGAGAEPWTGSQRQSGDVERRGGQA